MKTLIIWLAIVSFMAISHTPQAAVLESPNQGVNLSGIGFISGWKCNATNITVTINDGEHLSVAMHQERGDLIDVCGSIQHGFIKQVNWAWPHVSDGKHTVVAYDEGVEFGRATFTVGTLGEEFAKGLEKQITVEDFPSLGEHRVLEWNESTQHFEVLYTLEEEPGNDYENPTSSGGKGVLESPNQGVNLSGIGFISGWKCNATKITVTINDGEHLSVAMHQERGDLINVCGSIRHGFIKQVNWAWPHVSDGKHTVVAYDEGVEFSRATFTVGTLGEEFAKGLEKRITVEDFPSPGEYTLLEWNESTQHFEVVSVWGGEAGNNYDDTFWNEFENIPRGFFGEPWAEELLYTEVPNVENCEAGKLTELAKNRALKAVNQIRGLHGLSPLEYISRYDNQMQEASLIQEANNFPGHYPESSSKCYTEEGYEGSASSNLAGGTKNRDPAASMIKLTADAYNRGHLASVGHRRYILNPFVTYFSYGQVENIAAQKVARFLKEPFFIPQINVDFIAFPYGTYPRILLHGDPYWSFNIIVDKKNRWNNAGDFFENATITVTQVSNKKQLLIYNPYVRSSFISWKVEGWEHDTLYEVNIDNVTLNDGTTRDFSYSVFIKQPDIDN